MTWDWCLLIGYVVGWLAGWLCRGAWEYDKKN